VDVTNGHVMQIIMSKRQYTDYQLNTFKERLRGDFNKRYNDSQVNFVKTLMEEFGYAAFGEDEEKARRNLSANVSRWLNIHDPIMPIPKNLRILAKHFNRAVGYYEGMESMPGSNTECICWASYKHADKIKKAISILDSNTHYSKTLSESIESSFKGVKQETELRIIRQQYEAMNAGMKELKEQIESMQRRATDHDPPEHESSSHPLPKRPDTDQHITDIGPENPESKTLSKK
jgi:hypothetical protein